jgi:VIT1/CCC1 family predicted Fe2+/Mn2+ transporter
VSTQPQRRSLKRFVASHLASRQVSRVVYGSIIGLALVVALQAHPPKPGAMIATLLGTAIAVGLAEAYSELIGFETARHRRPDDDERRHLRGDIAAVAFGIAFPAIFFLLAAIGVFEDGTAFTVAKWTGLGLIGIYGFAGGRLSGRSLAASLLQGAGVALIGAFVIVVKSLVH